MPIRLRFAVHGVRNNRIFHLVAIDQRKRRNARPLELLGVYRPRIEQTDSDAPVKRVEWALDRVRFWLDHGAVPSESVMRMLQVAGVEKRTAVQLAQAKADAKALAEEKARLAEERRRKRAEAAKAKAERAAAGDGAPLPRRKRVDREPERFGRGFESATMDPMLLRMQNVAKVQADDEFAARMRERADRRRAIAAAVEAGSLEAEMEGDVGGPEDELVDIKRHEYGDEEDEAYDDRDDDYEDDEDDVDDDEVSSVAPRTPSSTVNEPPSSFVDERPEKSGDDNNSAPPLS